MRLRVALALSMAALAATAPVAAADEEQARWGNAGDIAVSPDGANVYAAGARTLTFARDPATGALTELDWHGPRGQTLAISPDGRWVYVGVQGDSSGAIQVAARDPSSGVLTHVSSYTGRAGAPRIGNVNDIALSLDGRQLYVAQTNDDGIQVLNADPESGALSFAEADYSNPRDGPMRGAPGEIELSPDGRFLYAADGGLTAFARDARTGALTPAATGFDDNRAGDGFVHVALAPDGARLYTGQTRYRVLDRDPATGALTQIGSSDLAGVCAACWGKPSLTVAPDSRSVIVAESGGGRRIFQGTVTEDGIDPAHVYTDGSEGFSGIVCARGTAWSPDGHSLYIAHQTCEPQGTGPDPWLYSGVNTFAWDGSRLSQVQALGPVIGLNRGPGVAGPGLSIDDGAIYTNDPNVQLRIGTLDLMPTSVRLSNDPDFTTSDLRPVSASGRYPWRLEAGGPPARTVTRVYARFTGAEAGTLADDIILDTVAPQVVSARLRRGAWLTRVRLSARDAKGSGVQGVQVATERSHPRPVRAFARTVNLRGSPRRVWVRVIDNAGNPSLWRRAAG
jgi:6-phosphogluconolactonase (cycloisomerase 2 family)